MIPPLPRARTIRSRLLAILIGSIVILAGIGAGIWELSVEPALRAGVERTRQEIARRSAEQIESFIQQRIGELVAAANFGRFWEERPHRQREILRQLLKLSPAVTEVAVADRHGREIFRVSRSRLYTDADLGSLSGQEKFEAAVLGETYISDVYHPPTAEPHVTIAVPIWFTPRESGGVLVAEINLKTLWDPISHIRVGQAGSVYVMDRRRRLLAHRDYSQVLLGTVVAHQPEVGSGVPEATSARVVAGPDGRDLLTVSAPVAEPQWFVVVEEPLEAALEGVRRVERLAFGIMLIALASSGAFAVWFSGRIARPVRQLEEGAAIIAGGHLDHRLAIATGDEIQRLAEAFNEMAMRLEASHQELERRVVERTRQSEARRRIAEAVAEVGGVLTRTRDPQTVSETVVDTVSRLYGAESASLFWLDQASGALVAWATTGMSARMAIEGSIFPAGTGVVGLAVRERRPVTTANLLSDPRITLAPQQRERIERASYRAVLAVPLLVHGDVVGALGLGNHEGRVFTAEEIQAAQTFADQAALALECARLYESSERRRREAEGLAQAARALTASLDAPTVAERTVARVLPLLNAPYAQLRLLRPDGSLEVMAVTSDHAEIAPVGHVLPPGMAVSGMCVRERRPIAMSNLHEDPVVELPVELRAAMVQASLGAVLAVPLIVEDEILGVLNVLDRPGRVFSSQELQLVQAFADQAAVAFKNARMLQDLKVHQGRLEALLESSRRLGHIQPVESLLSAIAEACGQLLDSRSVGFRLVEGDELVVAGTWGDAKDMMPTPRLKFGESLSGIVAATGEVLIVQDPGADPRLIPSHREVVRRSGYRAFLGVPVKLGERVLGVLSVRSHHAHGFTEEDVALATALAAHAAIALENARLFQDLRRAYDELSQTQGQLLHAQKMEAVGRLAGGIAHDFNNLLTVIIGRAQLLMQHLTAADLPRQDIELIENTARRGASLTRQLLAFSRKQILQPRPVNLSELVAELLPMLRRLLGEDVEIIAELAPRLGTAMVDPSQFEQIVVNLAVNARDAMPPAGGRLTLRTAEIELDEQFVRRNPGSAPGPHVMLTARDTGAGMTPDVLAHLFEPFFTTKPAGEGTGLGLSTVHGIVQQHGGYIAVESQPARGTTFRIYFPRIEVAAQAEDAERSTGLGVADGSGTVLVVEDEPDLRDVIRELLEAHGYETVQASDAAEALLLAERHHGPIHLLLTDVVMPGSNGRQLAERLVALRPETKVLYMSGYTDDRLLRCGVLEQGLRLVRKPFTPGDLLRQVREVLHPA